MMARPKRWLGLATWIAAANRMFDMRGRSLETCRPARRGATVTARKRPERSAVAVANPSGDPQDPVPTDDGSEPEAPVTPAEDDQAAEDVAERDHPLA
jgi:hypothetical protein